MTTFQPGSRAILDLCVAGLERRVGQECEVLCVDGLYARLRFEDGYERDLPTAYLSPVKAKEKPVEKQLSLPSIPAELRPRKSRERGYKRREPEFEEQCALFAFLRQYANKETRFGYVFAIPNGLYLSPQTARKAVQQGVLSGVWDILVPFPGIDGPNNDDWCGLFIEMKSGKNVLTDNQKAFEKAVNYGFAFTICYDWLEAARAICQYLSVQDKAILEAIR